MKTIIKEIPIPEKIIPARIDKKEIYIADDGTEFEYKYQCEKYENLQKRNKHILNKRIIETDNITHKNNIYELSDGYIAKLVYFKSVSEIIDYIELFNFNLEYNNLYNPYNSFYKMKTVFFQDECDFEIYGEGWYILYAIPGGDYDDDCYCLNFEHYIQNKEKELAQYKKDMYDYITQKQSEENFIKSIT